MNLDNKSADALRCSFCNKSQADVRKMVAGENGAICDECARICHGLMTGELEGGAIEQVTFGRIDLPTDGGLVCPKCKEAAGVILEEVSTPDRLEMLCGACGHCWSAGAPGVPKSHDDAK